MHTSTYIIHNISLNFSAVNFRALVLMFKVKTVSYRQKAVVIYLTRLNMVLKDHFHIDAMKLTEDFLKHCQS